LDPPGARGHPHALAICRAADLGSLGLRRTRFAKRRDKDDTYRTFKRKNGWTKSRRRGNRGADEGCPCHGRAKSQTGPVGPPGTGYPVLLIRLQYDTPEFVVATDLAPPGGFSFYYDDPNQKVRIVAFFDRCAHLCCPPGWHVITDTRPYCDYLVPSPTYSEYNQDPIFCVCHDSQYDPLLLTTNVYPRSG